MNNFNQSKCFKYKNKRNLCLFFFITVFYIELFFIRIFSLRIIKGNFYFVSNILRHLFVL